MIIKSSLTFPDTEILLRGVAEYLRGNFSTCISEDNTIQNVYEQLKAIEACFNGIKQFILTCENKEQISAELSERLCFLSDDILSDVNAGKLTEVNKKLNEFINIFYAEVKTAVNG